VREAKLHDLLTIDRVDSNSVILDHNFVLSSCGHGSLTNFKRVTLGFRDPCCLVRHVAFRTDIGTNDGNLEFGVKSGQY
jgi:hypothetical protein